MNRKQKKKLWQKAMNIKRNNFSKYSFPTIRVFNSKQFLEIFYGKRKKLNDM